MQKSMITVIAIGLAYAFSNVLSRWVLKSPGVNWQSVNLVSELTTLSIVIAFLMRSFATGTSFTFQPLAILPGIFVAVASLTTFYTLRLIPAGLAVPIFQAVQLVAVVLLGLTIGDVPTWRQVLGTLLAVAGILLNIR